LRAVTFDIERSQQFVCGSHNIDPAAAIPHGERRGARTVTIRRPSGERRQASSTRSKYSLFQ
jgi:hypothetical protein